MEYTPQTFPLKDGRTCLIRRPTAADGENILLFQRLTAGETPYLMVAPQDITHTPEEQSQRIERWNRSPRKLRLMAEVAGELAGVAILYDVGDQTRLRHRCSVDITLYRSFWGLGMGAALLGELLAAGAAAGYEQAELEVVSTNAPAIALYEKLGFQTAGAISHALKYQDGSYADFLWMIKPLP